MMPMQLDHSERVRAHILTSALLYAWVGPVLFSFRYAFIDSSPFFLILVANLLGGLILSLLHTSLVVSLLASRYKQYMLDHSPSQIFARLFMLHQWSIGLPFFFVVLSGEWDETWTGVAASASVHGIVVLWSFSKGYVRDRIRFTPLFGMVETSHQPRINRKRPTRVPSKQGKEE